MRRRDQELANLRSERSRLQAELDALRLKLSAFSDEMLLDCPPVNAMRDHVMRLESESQSFKKELDAVRLESDEIRQARHRLRAEILVSIGTEQF